MGVPVMELFLVYSADKTKRAYAKGILEARRHKKDFGKDAILQPIKVTLTKDGVLEALNAVPFKRREQGASALQPRSRSGVSAPVGALALKLAAGSVAQQQEDEIELGDWRKYIDWTPRTEAADYPVTGLYNPGHYPQFRARLKGKHPLYVMGFNKLGPPGQLKRKVV